MPLKHNYTTASLAADDARFLVRSPGVSDIERLFPSPSSTGRGRLAVEGGISVVAGPGMGKTSLLANLAFALDRNRKLATALVALPVASAYPGQDGFYACLGDLVRQLRTGLSASPRMNDPRFAPVKGALAIEPKWDAPGAQPGMSPRGFEGWISALGAAAVLTPGVCLLFDDIDHVAETSWKSAFVAGLRFTFQTSAGITPVYALWTLFADESLPGSNYFRNVTRPVFLEPLSIAPSTSANVTSERRALVDIALPKLPDTAAAELFRIVGGHPQLLHHSLAHLCAGIADAAAVATMNATEVQRLLNDSGGGDSQRQLARDLLARTPALGAALREIARGTHSARPLAKGMLATGLVDRDELGRTKLPVRVAEIL